MDQKIELGGDVKADYMGAAKIGAVAGLIGYLAWETLQGFVQNLFGEE